MVDHINYQHFCFVVADFFMTFNFFQSMILSPVRTLEYLGSAGMRGRGLALATQWHSTATRAIVSREQERSCAWEVAAACGAPLFQGVWVRGHLLLLHFLSCLCCVESLIVRLCMYLASRNFLNENEKLK